MRKRSERQQDFEAIKQDLFTAGVATVKAAQAQKNMYMTSLEALSEAYEGAGANLLEAGEEPEADLASLLDTLLTQRQTALTNQDFTTDKLGEAYQLVGALQTEYDQDMTELAQAYQTVSLEQRANFPEPLRTLLEQLEQDYTGVES